MGVTGIKPTFENLPLMVLGLAEEIQKLHVIISELNTQAMVEADKWMDIQELSEYLPGEKATPITTIYGWTSAKLIPFHKGQGKKLIFLKSEIDNWIKNSKVKTKEELKTDVKAQLKR